MRKPQLRLSELASGYDPDSTCIPSTADSKSNQHVPLSCYRQVHRRAKRQPLILLASDLSATGDWWN